MNKKGIKPFLLWILISLTTGMGYILFSYLDNLYIALITAGVFSILIVVLIYNIYKQKDIDSIKEYIFELKNMNLGALDSIDIPKEVCEDLHALANSIRNNLKAQIEISVKVFNICEKLNTVSKESLESANSIATLIETADANTMEQSNMLTDTNKLANEIVASLDSIEKDIMEKAEFISDSIMAAQSGIEDIRNIEDRISLSKKMIKDSMDQVLELKNYSNEIVSLIDLINAISKETNMLSLNASIEAARAGEQGKGFSVVATEVGRLANETEKAASSIQNAIYTLKDDIATIAYSMNREMEYMEENWLVIRNVNDEFKSIVETLNEGRQSLDEITNVTKENNIIIGQITGNIEKTTFFSQEIAAHMEETTSRVLEQRKRSEYLQEIVTDAKDRVYDMQQYVAGKAMEEAMLNGANYIRDYAKGFESFDNSTIEQLLKEVEMDLLHITDSDGVVRYTNEKATLGLNLYELDNDFLALKDGKVNHIVTPIKVRVQDGRLFKFLTIIDNRRRLFEVGLSLESLIE